MSISFLRSLNALTRSWHLGKIMLGPLLSGIFAALVAIGATVAIERLGGRLGGVLGSIPTTIVPASLGFFLPGRESTN